MWQARADGGDPDAQFQLGYCFETGQGTQPDMAAATRWYQRAAAQGHARAQYHLGLAFSNGVGVPWDLTEACKWLMLAAQGKLGEATLMLNTLKAPAAVRAKAVQCVKSFQVIAEPRIIVQEQPSPSQQMLQTEEQPGLDLWR